MCAWSGFCFFIDLCKVRKSTRVASLYGKKSIGNQNSRKCGSEPIRGDISHSGAVLYRRVVLPGGVSRPVVHPALLVGIRAPVHVHVKGSGPRLPRKIPRMQLARKAARKNIANSRGFPVRMHPIPRNGPRKLLAIPRGIQKRLRRERIRQRRTADDDRAYQAYAGWKKHSHV